jgi:hypothetical protein
VVIFIRETKEISKRLSQMYDEAIKSLKDPIEPGNEAYLEWLRKGGIKKTENNQKALFFCFGVFATAIVMLLWSFIQSGGLVYFQKYFLLIGLLGGICGGLFFLKSLRIERRRKQLMLARHQELYHKTRK